MCSKFDDVFVLNLEKIRGGKASCQLLKEEHSVNEQTMSSTEDNTELKAGHPPAVKAGGMRVARARQSSTGESKDSGDGDAEYSTTPPKSERHNQKMLISGVITSGDKDFTPVAVKHFHEKPMPSKEKKHVEVPHNIQQPR